MKEITCCFTGHRWMSESSAIVKSKVENAVRELIAKGVKNFRCGGAIGFDTICEQTILELKEEFPDIRLILDLPCRDQDRRWNEKQKLVYEEIVSKADEVSYASELFSGECMKERNRKMVDNSKYCVCFLEKTKGGTMATVKYAVSEGLEIISLADNSAFH